MNCLKIFRSFLSINRAFFSAPLLTSFPSRLSILLTSFLLPLLQNEMLSRLLRLYDLLPAQTSKWRKRRRRQDEEVQPEKGNAGMQRQYHVAAPDFGDNSR